MFNLFRKSKPAPQASLDDVDLHLPEIPEAVQMVEGFPRVQWKPVRQAAEAYAGHPAIGRIWTELAAQWLGIIRRHLGAPYEIFESNHLLLLTFQEPGPARRLLEIGDAAFDRLERMLERTPDSRGLGKHAVLQFQNSSAYYDYVTYFHSDRDRPYGASVGMHISRGYRHTVLNGSRFDTLRTLVHELAHDMVSHHPLPLWLNEGLAQFAEDMVPGYRAPLIDSRGVRLHRRYWSWWGMDHFWTGRAFNQQGSQRLSYQLADVLFRNLAGHRERGPRLTTLLATARRDDAGAAACRSCFGCTLAKLVEEFLGPGDWAPRGEKQVNA